MMYGMKLTTACLTLSLAACPVVTNDALFKDVQRKPPSVKETTLVVIVREDRPLAEWIEETARKCDEFGCVE